MKKRWCSVCTFLAVFFLCSTVAWGDANPIVRLGADNQITYIGSNATAEGNLIGDTFQGMAPGETRTQTITLSNENPETVAFYMSQETLQNLEETNQAAGGAYTVNLSIGKTQKDAVSLMDALAGGYRGGEASRTGLSDVDAIENYTYLTTLKQHETDHLYLTMYLNGEGMDSTSQVDYTASVAQIAMNFQVEVIDSEPEKNVITKTVTKIKNQVVPLADTVKTGDASPILFYSICLLAGIGLILMFRKKKRGADAS